MIKSIRGSGKVLHFTAPRIAAEERRDRWIRGILESNDELVDTLEGLRDSYLAVLNRSSVTDGDKILMAVETALERAEKASNMV